MTSQHTTLELIRFKVIQNVCDVIRGVPIDWTDDHIPVIGIHSTPSRDGFLCPLEDGKVIFISLNETQSNECSAEIYFPDCQVMKDLTEPNRQMFESIVEEIIFSPFDQDIFLMRWSNGLLGLFHRKDSVASLYLNPWNYSPDMSSSSSDIDYAKTVDGAISVQWSQMRPSVFYLLTKCGFFVTFDLTFSQSPIRCKKIKLHGGSLVNKGKFEYNYMTLLPSYNKSILPMVVLKGKQGFLFGIKQLEAEEPETRDGEDSALATFRALFYN